MSHVASSDEVSVLEHLRVLALDGAAGYAHAAAEVKEPPRLHDVLARNAADRAAVVDALGRALAALGGRPAHHGSLGGAVHRGWLSALNAFASDSKQAVTAIVHECERGEHHTIEGFRQALEQPLSKDVRDLLLEQLRRIDAASTELERAIDASGARQSIEKTIG